MAVNKIVVLDTETTGTDPSRDSLLEVGWAPVELTDTGWGLTGLGGPGGGFVEYVGEVPPEARAVHHIGPEDVAPGAPNCYSRDSTLHALLAAEEDDMVYAAHNAPFDRSFLPELTLPWIDTYRVALHLYPDAPSYKNQVLRYWLGAEPPAYALGALMQTSDGGEVFAPLGAHRAQYDAACTAAILVRMLSLRTAEELLELQDRPALLRTVSFGKHRGELWADLPRDYARWMMRSGNWADDKDVSHTLKFHFG